MIKLFSISFLILLTTNLVSQNLVLQGEIRDQESGQILHNVKVEVVEKNSGYKSKSNSLGQYQVSVASKKSKIILKREGYLEKTIFVKATKDEMASGVIIRNFSLFTGEMLGVVDIRAPGAPEEIYANEQHNVADFEFVEQDFLILTYDKNPKKERKLLLTNDLMEVSQSYTIPASFGEVLGLEKSYARMIFLNTASNLYQVEIKNDIQLTKVDRKTYDDHVKPIVDTINDKVYLSNWYEKYPAFAYYEYTVIDSSYKKIREIADNFMLELCRAEYKYLSGRTKLFYLRQEMKTGIDKEIWACIDNFDQGLYYDPIYAPMFIVNDTMLIFDHCDNLLCRYDMNRNPIDSAAINYHEPGRKINKTFMEILHKDEVTGNIFAQFQVRGGDAVLKKINTNTGQIKKEYSMKFPYPVEIKIKGDFAYYIYRPFESLQKKYLYREKLN
ncbi:MAG: hypothetical protein ACI86P_002046 [Flavobacteriales bacterium]|jgi:hypothetical protein